MGFLKNLWGKAKEGGKKLLGDAKSEGKNFLNQDVVGQLKSMLG